MLFDETTIRKLNQLSLVSRKIRAGVLKGERRSTKRGTSIEFADYRDYVVGDDLKRLDWNIYARLNRPFIKLLEEEEDLAVYILIDLSTSMNWGEKETNKSTFALHLAGALGIIALSSGDRLKIIPLSGNLLPNQYGPVRGSQNQFSLLNYLDNLYKNHLGKSSSRTTDLNLCLRMFSEIKNRPGLVFLLSDMFSPAGYELGLSNVVGRGFELLLLHILSPDELDPQSSGDLSFIDVETGETLDISLDRSMREAYRKRLSIWKEEINIFCNSRRIHYMDLNTNTPWEKIILYEMRKATVVK